ncbi:hypothetical protein A3D84_01125 [Candidatus Woesebacteria bacterium RIFCSPHIGHO2_02_FULL_42_20]|uniref:Uncharacterized protein n=1 Tax=Candidatus Woesebacteria bacterium RIFCSPHIGHO2_12_FULL_41_24 TaxID=1802510 RepID=A0A1F8AQ71_9BACT|nr:MAG: hypothetical protein A2W15_05350 [Candidatus Woesebacteria bacterium RBG_16_41_13]OGM30717.1 MAG: hypothetical protein A2873_01245 [Candidatus Woesebacteria bacterium RIFCSPHIGHO2_01_FULL_42_80]OGM35854.1 MAG: hypothetical protein A3D84_01125 [Candidatus Woesebacteria bacterium RIFCSPHIGHO2_02_FULL_42_20]OGM53912.1 MAG: hypothetical protein A3E44_05890 [Candidatus Woesebacteria bacterium RIFCSPHIGHO2_12_FULL_41_24]OGM66104.1 MAG: hypothetical protein A2969_03985 [Candidatus Woesebacteri
MKRLVRAYTIQAISLYFVNIIAIGLNFSHGVRSFLITVLVLTLSTYLIRPVVNILLLPLNLVTFGLFRWVGFAVTLLLVDLVLEEFSVDRFKFAGLTSELITIPAVDWTGFMAYVGFSFILSLLVTYTFWVAK